ncbi:uncharacterized protein LOC131225271 isoform X1 [Magnolia sinica]|uniref:uncharacterized protein LOC131225271 isoform X1 n=1 Tax=Magnolia sinica TaxID=86752 RepID=UPI0026584A1B|nr:uncharacterized protein LOC131225271 isoform X1 [Magnolia sinica]
MLYWPLGTGFMFTKELVVGFEIFEGIYSHPGLRTPAECVCGKLLEHPIGTFISTEWASYKRKSTLFRGHTHNLRVGSWLMMTTHMILVYCVSIPVPCTEVTHDPGNLGLASCSGHLDLRNRFI